MSTTNKVILIGNLGSDPEIRQLPSGEKVANFSIATQESYKDKDGEKQTIVDWHNIRIFNQALINIVEKYIKKGSKIYVEGSLKHSKYKDKLDNDRYYTFVKVNSSLHKLLLLDSIRNDNEEPVFNNQANNSKDYARMKDEGY